MNYKSFEQRMAEAYRQEKQAQHNANAQAFEEWMLANQRQETILEPASTPIYIPQHPDPEDLSHPNSEVWIDNIYKAIMRDAARDRR